MKQSDVKSAQLIPHVLVVDDDKAVCEQLKRLYEHAGYKVSTAYSGEQALDRLGAQDVDLVVTDIRLPGITGVELTKHVKEKYPDVPVIAIIGFAEIGTATQLLKMGASDYIVKPFDGSAILESTQIVLERTEVFREIRHLRRSLRDSCDFGGMLSKKTEMQKVFETVRLVANTDMTAVIEGETGTGKELVAKAIHFYSNRRAAPFITINCSGIPESLLESELFGHEKGAFTGAVQSRPGKIELANKGTLFLDEIESMSLAMQANLLRVLEERKLYRLGGSRPVNVDMRVIAATNVPLKQLVTEGLMRKDFYYRVSVVPIRVIPLRDRHEDIPLLVADFLRRHPIAVQKGIAAVSKGVMRQLVDYPWPGNIRELQNVLERSILHARGQVLDRVVLSDSDVERGERLQGDKAQGDHKALSLKLPLRDWMKLQEKEYLRSQLQACEED